VFNSGRVGTTTTVLLLLLPLLTVISYEIGVEIAPVASATSGCGNEQTTVMDLDKVESFSMSGEGMVGEDDDEWGFDESEDDGVTMRTLQPLTTSFYTSFQLENDTAVGLRMNLTTGWKYTFCIDILPLNDTFDKPVEADVYLLQEDDYKQYQWDFDSRNNEWDGMRDDIAHSAPWLQNLILWNPFRDVHYYEKVGDVEFAVALDHAEQSYSFWDDNPTPKTMFLMIESWDNIRDYDASPQNTNYSVDVTVLVEERFSLPNWTVSMVCCGGLLGILAAPFLVHSRYMKAGLDAVEAGGGDMMPHLETASERDQTTTEAVAPPQG